ncbi:hypothetical protein D9619_012304 [Psilocybe cf. subviscida]|uniref:Haloacid dehalogenase n=1 Tax=Psilocybe cf. subviscida TaxID=2480587 RepID=A0A8H5ERE6_9AGAR|nr:hypothetical protein D9619_012304 [Psilocybe cf. subviscida]
MAWLRASFERSSTMSLCDSRKACSSSSAVTLSSSALTPSLPNFIRLPFVSAMTDKEPAIKALVFDVFGTVVDWRSSVIGELKEAETKYGIQQGTTDWAKFAQLWRNGYIQTTRRVASGAQGPSNVDVMHRQILDSLLGSAEFAHVGAAWDEKARAEINLAWHRLNGWPDTVEGLTLLKENHILATLSNGNMKLLVDMAKHAGLPWDIIFSTELFNTFKPNPLAYQSAVKHLDLPPSQCAMVAAHIYDLRAAAAQGMRTIYVRRPQEDSDENGIALGIDVKSKKDGGEVDLAVESFVELAAALERMN